MNNVNIWTGNTPEGTYGNPYSSSTIIITTADMGINNQMRDALRVAGFSSNIMNNDNIPKGIANLGLEKEKDHFSFLMRAILFADPTVGKKYLTNLSNYVKVSHYTETSHQSTTTMADPRPETQRNKHNRIRDYSKAMNEMTHLRNQIIKKYGTAEYDIVDLETNF